MPQAQDSLIGQKASSVKGAQSRAGARAESYWEYENY